MNLKITVVSQSPSATADILADGSSTAIRCSFAPRSGTNGESLITTLPKALRDLGTASNLTLPADQFTVGTVFTRSSLPHTNSHQPKAGVVVADQIRSGVRDGSFYISSVKADGTSIDRYVSTDADLMYAIAVADALESYKKTTADFVTGEGLKFAQNEANLKALMLTAGSTEKEIEDYLSAKRKPAPKFVLPIREPVSEPAEAPVADHKKTAPKK